MCVRLCRFRDIKCFQWPSIYKRTIVNHKINSTVLKRFTKNIEDEGNQEKKITVSYTNVLEEREGNSIMQADAQIRYDKTNRWQTHTGHDIRKKDMTNGHRTWDNDMTQWHMAWHSDSLTYRRQHFTDRHVDLCF